MNSKKNKHKNKPKPNPNPPQKLESISAIVKSEETVEETPDIAIKSDERVPEIITEITASSDETKVLEGDTTPKKPKRNRGKKKKSDKDDENDENQEQMAPEPVIEEVKVIEESNDPLKIDTSMETVNITPTARKKKNKNKKSAEHAIDDQKQIEKVVGSTPIKEIVKSELLDITSNVKQEIISSEIIEPTEHEAKSTRKKNKKKKRSDSDRSDKADDTSACTAAFQQLLEPKEEKKEVNTDSKTEQKIITHDTIISDVSLIDIKNDFCKENIENKAEIIEAILQTKPETPEPSKEDGGKGKKKNKKDKKHPPNLGSKEQEPNLLEKETYPEVKNLSVTTTDIITEDIQKEKVTEEQPDVSTETIPDMKGKSPKPKAKIVRPVEKKHVEKCDTQIERGYTVRSDIIATEEKTGDLQTKTEILTLKDPFEQKEDIKTDILDSSKLKYCPETKKEIIDDIQRTENIKLPESGMGKKRKKSPKPTKRVEISAETTSPEPTITLDEDIKNIETSTKVLLTPMPLGDIPTKSSNESIINVKSISLDMIKSSCATEENTELKLAEATQISTTFEIPVQDPIDQVKATETSDKTDMSKQIFEALNTEQIYVPDMGKKKKRSPKLPKKSEPASEIKESTTNIDESVNEEERKNKSDSLLNLPQLEDIEIRTVKTDESEGAGSDVIPDIHYPRASSQLLDNNNNNLFIQEVITEDIKLNIPIDIPDIPFIQGSGETPIILPELVSTGITILEIDTTIKPSEEKTDLKSKVMEVNKDMEDLRKSIEKSLAELTAMEKTETETEIQFDQSKLEDTKPIELKQDINKNKEKTKNKHVETKLEVAPIECKEIKPLTIKLESTVTPTAHDIPIPPVCPSRKDNKGKNKSKKKAKQEVEQHAVSSTSTEGITPASSTTAYSMVNETKESSQDTKKEEKSEQKAENTQEKGKQQCSSLEGNNNTESKQHEAISNVDSQVDYNPIENFEDALTSSADDVNQSFEMIAKEADKVFKVSQSNLELTYQNNPEINITAPTEEEEKVDKQEKINPVSQPKNLIGHPDIPARLNKTDYKKEKNKTQEQAKVQIKDTVPIEVNKQFKNAHFENKEDILKDQKSIDGTLSMTNGKDEYIYKYSYRKVFLPSACHVCKKELKQIRVPCSYCNLIFYCSSKHKDEDYAQHQAFCFAVSTIVHLKDQKFIYADAKDVIGHNYRLLRMQMIVSCEKVLKRKLAPWEQEALLYPRICADVSCREWRQGKLRDCMGCGQLSYCTDHPDHFPKSHQRWCNSYSLYQKLVSYQQSSGRLVPKLPSRVMMMLYPIPEKLNEVLATMYEEKIDINDTQYAALTQVATAPLTAAYSQQLYSNKMNSTYANGVHKNSSFTIHVVGAELQFEADALNKWEVFFLHLRPDIKELRIVLIGPDLNSSNLPLALLGKINLCDNCSQNKRRVIFDFQDKKTYHEYWSTEYSTPDLVCAFNPSIHRASTYNSKDMWPSTIKCILKLKVPFVVTSYSMTELLRDLARIKESAEIEFNTISEPKLNSFASVRPDRNFISDDEIPLLFKNYCFSVVCGAF